MTIQEIKDDMNQEQEEKWLWDFNINFTHSDQ